MRGERSIPIRLPAIAALRTNAVVAHSRAVRLKSTRLHAGVLPDQREALADRRSWDMSPANAGLSGSQRPLELGHSGHASALLTCINTAASAY